MPNGSRGDHPLTDWKIHGIHVFPPEIERMLEEAERLDPKWLERLPWGEARAWDVAYRAWAEGRELERGATNLRQLLDQLRLFRQATTIAAAEGTRIVAAVEQFARTSGHIPDSMDELAGGEEPRESRGWAMRHEPRPQVALVREVFAGNVLRFDLNVRCWYFGQVRLDVPPP